jgi:hypothetical protein
MKAGSWLLCAVGLLLFNGPVFPGDSRVPLPEVPQGKGDRCVEPTPVIRRNHMEFLLHQRDETMHLGIRTKKHSLNECVECHVQHDAQGQAIPVNAPGQFCDSCHRYAGVNIDCFQCHATTPDSGSQPPHEMSVAHQADSGNAKREESFSNLDVGAMSTTAGEQR